jgi:hypothetical protein
MAKERIILAFLYLFLYCQNHREKPFSSLVILMRVKGAQVLDF